MQTNAKTAEVTLPNDTSVLVERDFSASRELVYAAYTQPALMQRWLLGTPGWTMPVCEMDVRVGGRFRWRWRSDEDGGEFGFEGEFVEVDAPALIRHTEAFDAGSTPEQMEEAMVTVRFEERGGTTSVSTLIEYASKEARDGALATGMTDGMEASYQQLDTLLRLHAEA
jgi:uncharacterized protein YndB with AHSA1/START domain